VISFRALRETGPYQRAAEFLVFCIDVRRLGSCWSSPGGASAAGALVTVHYGTMEVLLTAANIATAAEALGYGTCFIGAILDHLDLIVGALQLPQGVLPVVDSRSASRTRTLLHCTGHACLRH